jgi:acetyl/propionyl-CoA carboxylase alpha subunit/acetyl-CoA carboxylase carboxyltransferase component
MPVDFKRVAIINRGDPAMRFIHAVRGYNRDRQTQIRTIVFYSSPDRKARFVREADESVDLGRATFFDAKTGQRKPVYADYSRLEPALISSRADAAWVGWGFASEQPEFADLCSKLDIVFLGPPSAAMRRLGDKIIAKKLAEEIGVPVIPWCGNEATTIDSARAHAQMLGYPVMVKAAAGEGGRGIRKVDSEDDLPLAFASVCHEAQRFFGDPTVYVEKWIEGARHVEVQLLADNYGTSWAVGVRDCTIQRRHQKILEEAPALVLSKEQEQSLRDAAVKLSSAAGYRSAGTVEFLYDPASQQYAFMEVNVRLQVEHAVTELTTGLDLVKLQIHLARGARLEGKPPIPQGHAIEVRLNAEDPENGFAPAPGRVELLKIPTSPGLRLDVGVAEGDDIPPEFDSMFGKLIAWGRSREEALARLRQGLEESGILVLGGATNRAFLLNLLERPEVRKGTVDVGWLDREAAGGGHVSAQHANIALLRAAIDVYDAELEDEREQFFASAARMRPVIRTESGRPVELSYQGHRYRFTVYRHSSHHYRIEVDGIQVAVELDRVSRFEQWLRYRGNRHRVLSVVRGLTHLVEVEGAAHKISRDDAGTIRAAAPSVVVGVSVKPGDRVSAGARLALLEAMKMEIPVLAPFSGTVQEVFVLSNSQVGTGSPLLRLEADASDGPKIGQPRISFHATEPESPKTQDPAARIQEILADLRYFVLGSDLHPAEPKRLIQDYLRLSQELPFDHEGLLRDEDDLLNIFVDISSLFRRQVTNEDPERLSTSEYLLTYLRTMESRGGSFPPTFIRRLQRALRHYGSDSLDPARALRSRLHLIFRSHYNMEQQVPAITAILERRLGQADKVAPRGQQDFSSLLDRLIRVTEAPFPVLSDLARDVRYRYFEMPIFDRARETAYAGMDAHLSYLSAYPDAADRSERLHPLVSSPHPLMNLLSERFAKATPEMRRLMLEVLTRRYYRIRNIKELGSVESDGRCFVHAAYDHEEERIRVISTHAEKAKLGDAVQALIPVLAGFKGERQIVVDFYAWQPSPAEAPDTTAAEFKELLNGANLAPYVRRVVLCIASPRHGRGGIHTQHFTFCPGTLGYVEERLYRGLHPMTSKRLQLWRLQNFDIERLPSAEDIYLFKGVARENPKDERLFAIGEVPDLTPIRDKAGNVVQLPFLERTLMDALAAIRQVQLRRPPEERLHWNRVLLYVQPVAAFRNEELQTIARRLAWQTEGLGLEKVVIRARMTDPDTGNENEAILSISNRSGRGMALRFTSPSDAPIRPLSEYKQKVVKMRQRGLTYPYEIIHMLAPQHGATQAELPPGQFIEYDLDEKLMLVSVDRPYGSNKANIVVGIIRNVTEKYPEGMTRVILLGDPSREMGSLAEPECRRIIAALDLASSIGVPLEWFALSAGAKISMESGTENMDWISRVLRHLVEFTQAGGEVNVIVTGINVGAQPYWNAEATMLMHTRGILIMMPDSAMVLTGKTALDYSGSVSADTNEGIGGYERVMGPNGQAQYWVRDIAEACQLLMCHYNHTYVFPGERFPRRSQTSDPDNRDVREFPHKAVNGDGFALVGDIFSDETNPGRKKPFNIRSVMLSVTDQDHKPLERWPGMQDAEVAIVWDAHIGGHPVCLIGFESRQLPRIGFVATDGPEQWTSGTLFPMASKKVARAINASSFNRPLVILANLSGFDGSPESMRHRQLEFGAEIGRAIVNFKGPIVFCVISRYHGGAFVVFSRALSENMEIAALEGTFASVIGGAPAAAVVFAREVDNRTRKDPRIIQAEKALLNTRDDALKRKMRADLAELQKVVRSEKLGEVAEQFDQIHSVHRALKVGSLSRIIPARELRPYLIDAIQRGIAREMERIQPKG